MEYKKRKILIGIAIASVVVIVFIIGKIAFRAGLETSSVDNAVEQEQETEEGGQIKKEIANENQVEKEKTFNYRDEITFPKSTDKPFTEIHAINIEEQVRKLHRDFDFKEAGNLIYSTMKEYNVEDSNHFDTIGQLFLDNTVMQNFEYMDDKTLKVNFTKTIKDPESQLIATLFLDDITREYLIYNEDSLNPAFKGTIIVNGESEADKDGEIYREAKQRDKELQMLHEFEIELEENVLLAYVVETRDGSYVYAIIEKEGTVSDYLTMREWSDLRKELGIKG